MPVFCGLSRILSVLVCLGVLGGCIKREAAEQKIQALPVRVEKLESAMVADITRLVGLMDSRKSVTLFPRVDGYIAKIHVLSGQKVNGGQLLMEIDPTRQQATVAAIESEVQLAAADLEKEKGELESLQSDRGAKKARLEYESLQFERFYWLQKKDVVAQAMVDSSDTSKKVAQADIEAMDAKISAQRDVIVRAEKRLESTRNRLKEQQTILSYYYIRAPFSGIIGDLPIKEGDYVQPRTKLTSVSQNKPLEINVDVPKHDALQLHEGLEVELLNASGDVVDRCPIFYVSPTVDPSSQSVLVKASYPNKEGLFRPAQSVEVQIVFSKKSGLTVPSEALSFMAGKPFVFVASTGPDRQMKANQRPVTIPRLEENRAIVSSGLQPGDLVIVSGVQNLFDGAPITIAK